uniref:StAR-related lipid transfer protein 3 n=1 Tax=Lygus hesperus TaxID=30085 RepID=A0A0A9ZFD8_LYGHE
MQEQVPSRCLVPVSPDLAGPLPSQPVTPQYPYMPWYPPPNFMRGARLDGRMSAIRRFFCLFVTFDLLLTSLLWLITLMLGDQFDLKVIVEKQILHYKIKSSLFDIVMASASRFVVLLLFYGFVQINHWFVVALTTAGTGVFVVAKVIMFDWDNINSQVLLIMLVLSSFVLSWAEAWLLDIKVIPQERYAQEVLSAGFLPSGPPSVSDERTRLIAQYAASIPPSESAFYSPLEDSTDDSSDEADTRSRRSRRHRRVKPIISSQNEANIVKAKEIVTSSWQLLTCDKWTFEKVTDCSDTIESFKLDDGYKVFKLTSILDVNASELFNILYHRLADLPKWNPTIEAARVLELIDLWTDISYQVSKKVGLIASREYVTLRRFEQIGSHKVIATASILYPRLPSSKNVIRGDVGPSCWAIREVDESTSEVQWLLNTKINGWIPVKAVETALSSVMANTITHLRRHCESLPQQTPVITA